MENTIFSTTDVFNRTVDLKESTWNHKILNTTGSNSNHQHGNSHPEMNDYLDQIPQTIEQPLFIIRDTTETTENNQVIVVPNSKREEFYRVYNDETSHKLQGLKVIVEFDEDSQSALHGEIVTTHKVSKVSSINTSGGIIYAAQSKK